MLLETESLSKYAWCTALALWYGLEYFSFEIFGAVNSSTLAAISNLNSHRSYTPTCFSSSPVPTTQTRRNPKSTTMTTTFPRPMPARHTQPGTREPGDRVVCSPPTSSRRLNRISTLSHMRKRQPYPLQWMPHPHPAGGEDAADLIAACLSIALADWQTADY